jgi:hypothetical protein
MRAPRYRFPNEVRETTRTIASRMVQDGTVAQTPEQLDAWISKEPEVREPLQRGGYGTSFTSHDLFPLLQVFVAQAGGPAPRVEEPPPSSRRGWLVGLGLALALLALALAIGVLQR